MDSVLRKRNKGLIGVILAGMFLLAVFFGKIILSLNTSFFSISGDGIQSYFNSTYLARYDTSLLLSRSMNYPYGELSLYNQSQPLLIAPVKFISNQIYNINDYLIGIINFFMLASILLGALFLFLLFYELGLNTIWSVLAATGIAFLSPQIDRMGGHFTLSYVWALPILFYLLLKYHNTEKTIYNIWIAVALFILLSGHVYFAGFYFGILFVYWIFKIYKVEYRKAKLVHAIAQFTIQIIVPVLLFYSFTTLYKDYFPERPSKPYGFFIYQASPESVFLPLGLGYGSFLHNLKDFSYVEWEGRAYVGITAVIGFLIILIISIIRLFKGKWVKAFMFTGNSFLDVLFWSSFLMLGYSFGKPFEFGLETLVEHLGSMQQIRAIGRFAWPFFFIINIVVFYMLWQWQNKGKNRSFVFWIALSLLFMDVYYFLKDKQFKLYNRFPEWIDYTNQHPDYSWMKNVDYSQFQAIIPVPFYHMGSDNFNIPIRCNMLANSFLVSIKSGLPVLPIYLSRASVEHSAQNISIVLEQFRKPELLDNLPDKRAFLLIAGNCTEITTQEMNLLDVSEKIASTHMLTFYRLPYDSLANMHRRNHKKVLSEWNAFGNSDTFINCKSSYLDFDSTTHSGFKGNALLISKRGYYTLFEGNLKGNSAVNLKLCFWLNPINRDLVPKTKLIIEVFDSTRTERNYLEVMCGDYIKAIDYEWGLFEYPFTITSSKDIIRVSLKNELIQKNFSYYVDEFLLIPDSCNFFMIKGNELMKNNRWYKLKLSITEPE